MPAVVCIVGRSDSGKTTLLTALVGELSSRGYAVATVKHAPEGASLDREGKDSHRHVEAGSRATAVASNAGVVLIKPLEGGGGLEDVMPLLGEEYDIVLAEGFKAFDAAKIEVRRGGEGEALGGLKRLTAVVSDAPVEEGVRRFATEDIKGLADLLEEGFIKPNRERVSLYVNGESLTLSTFPKQVVANIALALASSLKGVGRIKSLALFLKRGS